MRLWLIPVFAALVGAYQTSAPAPPSPPAAAPPPRIVPPRVVPPPAAPAPEPRFGASAALDAVIEDAIRADQIPGAVVLIAHKGQIIYEKAYGARALVPRREPMTLDTIFDAASLTKVIATTPGIMKLVETGKLRLGDRVTTYLPEFQGGKSEITVRQLLTHFSGLRPILELAPSESGYDVAIHKALIEQPVAGPGARFAYSDINFILLGEIVHRLSGKPLPDYVREQVFEPLGMTDTMFQPPAKLYARIAPTELMPGTAEPLRGVVHDPRSRLMGGIAGHAGLFTTAADLSKFAEMMLGMGERHGVRVFSPLTVRRFTTPQSPADQPVLRGLGWDIDSPYSSPRGDLYPVGSYGHTGFTGTSLWIDPSTGSYVILLANSVHPKLRPAISPLRARVANVAAAALVLDAAPPAAVLAERPPPQPPAARAGDVLAGLDVLAQENFASLRGKRVGLITNHTGLRRDGRRNVDLMVAAGVDLKALFSPEHGLAGTEDHSNIGHAKDSVTGIPVWSLYLGQSRRPNDDMLRGLDVLVFDIQDAGARFYTYSCTMLYAMEAAAKHKIEFVVLDRPNPITGEHVEGPMLDPAVKSFVGCLEMPLRHGLTMGEMALLANQDLRPQANLRVVAMKNWNRRDWFDATGLIWVDPSPNMRSLNAALLYPGVAMLEYSKVYSVGRGTDAPFEQVGADWMRGRELAAYLNARRIPGIRVYPTQFRPSASNFAGQRIEGVRFVITDREVFDSTRFGLELASAIARLFPGRMQWAPNEKLVGSRAVLEALEAGEDPTKIQMLNETGLRPFIEKRAKFLLY